jgi:hypothetical protein
VTLDPYAERLARVRERFVTTIESKIETTCADLRKLCGTSPAVNEAVGEAYRRIHGIVGIGPTVGFAATGKAAKTVEDVLLAPHRSGRGLEPAEIDALRSALAALREAARMELQSAGSSR